MSQLLIDDREFETPVYGPSFLKPAVQSVADVLKFDESQHPRDKEGKFTKGWHLTEDPHFIPDPTAKPEWNSLSGDIVGKNRPAGLFVTKDPEFWMHAHGYERPYVAEVEGTVTNPPGTIMYPSHEQFMQGSMKTRRVLTIDEYAREVFHDKGWVEDYFNEGPKSIPKNYVGRPVSDMSPAEIQAWERKFAEYVHRPDGPIVRQERLSEKQDLGQSIAQVLKYNKHHEPAGSPKGGEFASSGESVSLYRGDAQDINPDLAHSDPSALFGAGIYLTDNKRIAGDYKAKGAEALFRYDGGTKGTKEKAIEAYISQLARSLDAKGHPLEFPEALSGYVGKNWPPRLQKLADADIARKKFATKQWKAMEKSVDVRKMADGTVVFQKKEAPGRVAEYAIPKAWLAKTLDAEAPITEPVAAAIHAATLKGKQSQRLADEIYQKATTENEDGERPTFREIYREAAADAAFNGFGLTEQEGQEAFRDKLKDLGYTGIRYAGGITMGGAKHTAYVFWDDEGLKKLRKKIDVDDAVSVLKFNSLHEPAGSPKGGQFASRTGQPQGNNEATLQPTVEKTPAEVLAASATSINRRAADARQRDKAFEYRQITGIHTETANRLAANEREQRDREAAMAKQHEEAKAIDAELKAHEPQAPIPVLDTAGQNATTQPLDSYLSHASVTNPAAMDEGGANVSMRMDLDNGMAALYKPEIGEAWPNDGYSFRNHDIDKLITNKDLPLAEREAMAYEVGRELFGLHDNPVPPTVLRENLIDANDIDVPEGETGQFDPDDLQQMYDHYKQSRLEGSAYDQVGEKMQNLYEAAQEDHLNDIKKRYTELQDIWGEVAAEQPSGPDYGSESLLQQHPTLPLGSQAFERAAPNEIDPLELMKGVEVNFDGPITESESELLKREIRQEFSKGGVKPVLGEIDEDKAREDLDRDQFIEDHADTEGQLLDQQIPSFTEWKQKNKFHDYDSAAEPRVMNTDAKHPNGGSLQLWVDGLSSHAHGPVTPEDEQRMALLDYAIGTMDRHGGNTVFKGGDSGPDGDTPSRPIAIDNGYTFPGGGRITRDSPDAFLYKSQMVNDWLRNDDAHEMTDEFREKHLSILSNHDVWDAFVKRHPGMSESEREGFLGRIDKLKEAFEEDAGYGLYNLWSNTARATH